jgi:hypothetical protein
MSDSHSSSSETVATLKLLLIGSSGTGKSSLLMRFVDGVFLAPDEISATIGVDFKVKVIDVEGKKYKLTIWVRRPSPFLTLAFGIQLNFRSSFLLDLLDSLHYLRSTPTTGLKVSQPLLRLFNSQCWILRQLAQWLSQEHRETKASIVSLP